MRDEPAEAGLAQQIDEDSGMFRIFRSVPLAVALLAASAAAQESPAAVTDSLAVTLPEGYVAGRWLPFAVYLDDEETSSRSPIPAALAAHGFAVAIVPDSATPERLAALCHSFRRQVRIEQGGMHVVLGSWSDSLRAALLANRHQFQTFTLLSGIPAADLVALQKLPRRRVQVLAVPGADAVAEHCLRWHRARSVRGPAAAIARTLDSFHDAAAVADGERYFAILPEDAVFLGTDATERWTGAHFRGFAARYFERPSAWTYVPLERHITIAPGGEIAWFDEVLDNGNYGECRGTGVLTKRGEAWVLRQYNLTVPVPNALMGDVARRIRAFLDAR